MMRRTPTNVIVSDHAVLRYIEREHDVDVEAIRQLIAGLAQNGAELRALGIRVGRVKLICRETSKARDPSTVVVVTVLRREDVIRRP